MIVREYYLYTTTDYWLSTWSGYTCKGFFLKRIVSSTIGERWKSEFQIGVGLRVLDKLEAVKVCRLNPLVLNT